MEIALTPDLENLIRDEVESGRYATPAEVIRAALHIFRQPETAGDDDLRREIQRGVDDIENGRYTVWDRDSLPDLATHVKAPMSKNPTEIVAIES